MQAEQAGQRDCIAAAVRDRRCSFFFFGELFFIMLYLLYLLYLLFGLIFRGLQRADLAQARENLLA